MSNFFLIRHDPAQRMLYSFPCECSCAKTCAARLNGLDLGLGPGQPLEALGELGAIEVVALGSLNWAEGAAGNTANVAARLVQRAVLLGLLAVARERIGKRAGGRSGMNLRSVVDFWRRMSATQAIDGCT